MDNDTQSDKTDDVEFDEHELVLIEQIRDFAEARINDLDLAQRQRLFLASAGALVDAASEHAAEHIPGMKVVELCLLGERLNRLACGQYED